MGPLYLVCEKHIQTATHLGKREIKRFAKRFLCELGLSADAMDPEGL